MGEILSSFTYPRNALASTASESADKTHATIQRARENALLEKDEPFNDAKSFLGVCRRDAAGPAVTALGEAFETHFHANRVDAWRWLITRTMWRFQVPNGTGMSVNAAAVSAGVRFNFFDLLTRVIWMLSAQPTPNDALYFDELLPILDDDSAWSWSSEQLFDTILGARGAHEVPPELHRPLLGDLEDEFNCGRDNIAAVFRKAFGQSGLFDLVTSGALVVGIRLSDQVSGDPVLWKRLRYVLDHPVSWAGSDSDSSDA